MTWFNVLAMLVWTGVGVLLLFALMLVDSFFTGYKDMHEMRNGNTAVAVRFVMKLFAQGYILSQAMQYNDLWQAVLTSVVSFAILFVLEMIVRRIFKAAFRFDLDGGTQQGSISHALVAGSLHGVGALVLAATL